MPKAFQIYGFDLKKYTQSLFEGCQNNFSVLFYRVMAFLYPKTSSIGFVCFANFNEACLQNFERTKSPKFIQLSANAILEGQYSSKKKPQASKDLPLSAERIIAQP